MIKTQTHTHTHTKKKQQFNEKKRSERRKQCALAVVRRCQRFSPRRRPLSGGGGHRTAKI